MAIQPSTEIPEPILQLQQEGDPLPREAKAADEATDRSYAHATGPARREASTAAPWIRRHDVRDSEK